MTKITIKKVKNAIHGTGGILESVAQKCDCSRQALYNFIEKHPQLRDDVEQERERLVDLAESNLFGLVREKSWKAIRYLLSTKGRRRGYVERQEVEHSGLPPVKGYVTVSPDDWDNNEKEKTK